MKLTKYKLGDLIELYSEKCNISNLTVYDVSGINREKEFFEPSKSVGNDTSKYKIVPQNYFACNLMHVGRDKLLPISFNSTKKNKIVSPAYTVFKIKKENILLPEYFFVFIKSQERDRLFWFNTDSSVREGLEFKYFCDIDIELPSLEIQEKYVNIYKGLLKNQKSYETGLEDLKLTCDIYIENLKIKYKKEEIGQYLIEKTNKGTISDKLKLYGLNNNIGFTKSKTNSSLNKKFKIANYNDIVYPPPHFGNIGTIGIFKYSIGLVSPMYIVFECDKNYINPDYLIIWFKRKDFMRYAFFKASDSIRDTFDFPKMKEYSIPIPPLEIQNAIANIYIAYNERKAINERLKDLIKDICPILIKGSIEEGRKG